MGEIMELQAEDGHSLAAYRADPVGVAKGGLVVIQEIFGVNAHIREVCDRFAAAGYIAIAPAMFDRVKTGVELNYDEEGIAAGRELMGQLGWDSALMDVSAAVQALRSAGKVGVVGYCWGGSLAWLTACRMDIDAAVGYYGGQIPKYVGETPRAPVMLHFGETDASIPLEGVEEVKAAHSDIPVYTYPAGHGFSCDHRASFHEESSALALTRTLDFFAEKLA